MPRVELAEIAGGTPAENAATVRAVLAGDAGPRHATSCCSTPARRSSPRATAADLAAAVERAGEAVDSGAAAGVLDRLVVLTDELAPAG